MDLLFSLDRVFDEDGSVKDLCIDIAPPLPILRNDYWCGKEFLTESISKLFNSHVSFGIVLIGGEEVLMYNLCGSKCNQIDKITIHRLKNHKMGGQSAQRFNRIHDNQENEYIKKISERINSNYINRDNGSSKVKKLIIAGVGDIKDRVLRDGWLDKIISQMCTKPITLSQLSLNKVLEKLPEIISQSERNDDENVLNELDNDVTNNPDLVIYGEKEILEAMENSNLKLLIIHSSLKEKFKGDLTTIVNVIILTSMTDRCTRFINDYGGVIGKLWYPINNSY